MVIIYYIYRKFVNFEKLQYLLNNIEILRNYNTGWRTNRFIN